MLLHACLERCADLHIAQLMPLPLTVSCFSKIQIGFTFLVLADSGSPRQRAVKRVCVRVRACVRACVCVTNFWLTLTMAVFHNRSKWRVLWGWCRKASKVRRSASGRRRDANWSKTNNCVAITMTFSPVRTRPPTATPLYHPFTTDPTRSNFSIIIIILFNRTQSTVKIKASVNYN